MSDPTPALARRVIELACLAPSVHNTQPWLWKIVGDDTIELYADHSRQLLVSDPEGRNLTISCGAALHQATVAAECLGLRPTVSLTEEPVDTHLLATITLAAGHPGVDAPGMLELLADRRTDRRRFTSWPVPEDRLAHLAQAAAVPGAHVVALTDVTLRHRTETLVERARVIELASPPYLAEQRAWIDRTAADGVPASNVAPALSTRSPGWPNRFTVATAGSDDRMIEGTDGLIAICTAYDDRRAWLQAGKSLSALLLTATAQGFSPVPLSQVIELPETREALRLEVFDDMARPQILVRIGWGEITRDDLPPSPRRPLEDVLVPA